MVKLKKERPSRPTTPGHLTDASDTDTGMPSDRPKQRRRLSQIFGRKKDKEGTQTDSIAPTTTATDSGNTLATVPTPPGPLHNDSAYASSDAPSNPRTSNSNSNMEPIQNEGNIQGVNQDRNLAVNKMTGDIHDEDTGEVVSTVTTTTMTTTTTTTTSKNGKRDVKTDVVSHPVSSTAAATAPNRGRENSVVSEMPADPVPRTDAPALPVPGQTSSSHTPNASINAPFMAPDIPDRSPRRQSREFNERPPVPETVDPVPSSPIVGTNFGSNFNRTPQSGTPPAPVAAPPAQPPMQQQQDTPTSLLPGHGPGPSPGPTPNHNAVPPPLQPHPQQPMSQSYPSGPDDYNSYTHESSIPYFRPDERNWNDYRSGAPSVAGLSTIDSMSEETDSIRAPSSVAPSRAPSSAVPHSQAPPSNTAQPSTFGSLKAAAKGLHGVGETLRGTLNNEIDTRFPRKNAEKAAIANAKNQAALEKGQGEMSGLAQFQRDGGHPTGTGSGLSGWRNSIQRKPVNHPGGGPGGV